MNKRKYPIGMFIMGVVLKLFLNKWRLLVFGLALLLAVARIFFPIIPIVIPLALLFIWLASAIVSMLIDRKTVLDIKDNGEGVSLDKMFADNNKGYRNVIDTVNEYIDNQKHDV